MIAKPISELKGLWKILWLTGDQHAQMRVTLQKPLWSRRVD
jgi:hypothetical protein